MTTAIPAGVLPDLLDHYLSDWLREDFITREYRQPQVRWTAGATTVLYTATKPDHWILEVRGAPGELFLSSLICPPDEAAGLVRVLLGLGGE